jgi:hypothetical protein
LRYIKACRRGHFIATGGSRQIDDVRKAARISAGRLDRVLLDLLHSRPRQAGHDVDPARRLVAGEACSLQCSNSAFAASFSAIGRLRTMQASTSSLRSSSFTDITAACCTVGWVSSTASTSAAAMLSPDRRMMFFLRDSGS